MPLNSYEMEKEDEKTAERERQFIKSVLFHLPLILIWLLVDKIKEIIK